jgi:hypothetical protein
VGVDILMIRVLLDSKSDDGVLQRWTGMIPTEGQELPTLIQWNGKLFFHSISLQDFAGVHQYIAFERKETDGMARTFALKNPSKVLDGEKLTAMAQVLPKPDRPSRRKLVARV